MDQAPDRLLVHGQPGSGLPNVQERTSLDFHALPIGFPRISDFRRGKP
jgi:hypothetical protein